MCIRDQIRQYYDFWFGASQIYEEWAKSHGLTSNTLFVLYTIDEYSGRCTQQIICERLLLPKQTTSSILAELQAQGYIKKEPSSEDRRSKIVSFTEKGRQYAENILKQLYRFEERALSGMTVGERTDMLENCSKFLQQLQNSIQLKEEK